MRREARNTEHRTQNFERNPMLVLRLCLLIAFVVGFGQDPARGDGRPNIFFAISDDQSYPYSSAYGCPGVRTPAFDRVAREGVLFENAFVPSPGCSPTRASILTGRYPWQNEHAGTHASSFSSQLTTYPVRFQAAGYHVGFTGKGWGPGNFRVGGFSENPAGPQYSKRLTGAPKGVRANDYAAAFEQFLDERKDGQPFCFWYGGSEPHRSYDAGIGVRNGRPLTEAFVPTFLPDVPEVRSDILDYCYEIEWFDQHLARMLKRLEELGELDNTLVVVTSDNGMPFPRAKANVYEFGIHVPLAIRWGTQVPGGRTVKDLVNLVDLMPTYLEAAGIEHGGKSSMAGRSLMPILKSNESGHVDLTRRETFSGRERHSSSRWNNLGYPQRGIRTDQYLFIRNFSPERWPAGAPRKLGAGNYPADTSQPGPWHAAYHDIDDSPSLQFLIRHAETPPHAKYLRWSVEKRPAEELYDIREDPGCLNNLANDPSHQDVRRELAERLNDFLRATQDPRVLGNGDRFETYKRYSRLRQFPKPDWAE